MYAHRRWCWAALGPLTFLRTGHVTPTPQLREMLLVGALRFLEAPSVKPNVLLSSGWITRHSDKLHNLQHNRISLCLHLNTQLVLTSAYGATWSLLLLSRQCTASVSWKQTYFIKWTCQKILRARFITDLNQVHNLLLEMEAISRPQIIV